MPTCAVSVCDKKSNTSNLQKDGVTFHIFPKDPVIKKKWTQSCKRKRNWEPTRTSTICSVHFDQSQFQCLPNKRRKLVDNAVPTLLLSDTESETLQESKVPGTSQCQPCIVKSYVNVESNIELTPRKKKMRKKIEVQAKKIKQLQSKTRYLKKKVASLQEILKTLNEKSLIDKEQKLILQNIGVTNEELLKRQMTNAVTGKTSRKPFSPELRCFALNLNYYSPKAYRYIRKVFTTALPHSRTLTKWYATVDGRPGFTQESLNALKRVQESSPDKKIYCSLVIDEMKIKHNPEWHPKSERYYGYVDYGFDNITENNEEATDALVFLLVGINTTWKLPIGYFLVKGTPAALKARLVTKALELVGNTGVEIKALTCDGTKSNIAMAEELGCCMDPDNLQTKILDPTSGQQVHFFLDPCHMLKLIRNTFEHYKYFINNSGEKIEWNHILKLHQVQEEELFFLANKLRSNHIYFKSKIMNVRLAAQLFSESVADAITFCEDLLKLPGFINVHPTADFLKIVNDVFDILDSKTHGFGYKRAMNLSNYQECFAKLDNAKELIKNLSADVPGRNNQISRKNILKSPRYTGFLGFCVCIESAKSLFEDLILNPRRGLSYLPYHKISQDHIEILFSTIRSHGGFSDNPTARLFETLYKKLLIHKELSISSTGTNCIPLEKISILNCSPADKINNTTTRKNISDSENVDLKDSDDIDFECQMYLSPFGEKVVEYIAGFVAFSLSKKIKCDDCLQALFSQSDDKSLIYHKTKGYLKYASESVIQLCCLCEKIIRQGLDDRKKLIAKYTTSYVTTKGLHQLVGVNLFPNIEMHDTDIYVNHKVELAKAVMNKYSDTRISYLVKKTDPSKCIRHIYTKLIHFKNQ